jgi:hypothetical protein
VILIGMGLVIVYFTLVAMFTGIVALVLVHIARGVATASRARWASATCRICCRPPRAGLELARSWAGCRPWNRLDGGEPSSGRSFSGPRTEGRAIRLERLD